MVITWKHIDVNFLNWLRNNYETRIPQTNYGSEHYKPFFGSLFEFGNIIYVTQVSSPKARHYKMKNTLDFYKIYNQKNNDIIAVVNVNFMFPVHKSLVDDLQYKNIDAYRKFKTVKEKGDYINLMNIELAEINKLNLEEAAKKIYDLKYTNPEHSISLRSFDFKLLENACETYIKKTVNIKVL